MKTSPTQVPAPHNQASTANMAVDFRSDLGNAHRLVSRHGRDLHFIAEWGAWIVWNPHVDRWEVDIDGAVTRLAVDTVLAMLSFALTLNNQTDRDALLQHAMRSQSEQRLKAMVSLARSEAGMTISADRLDANPYLLGVQNGVIELKTGTFRAARREDLITKHAGVSFDPVAACPHWEEFLKTVTGGDVDLQTYLQRVAGYALTGSVQEEVMFMLYGTGRNGKSTFRETLHELLGSYALAADATLLVERKSMGGATEEIARLKGRRFVAVNETAESDQVNESRVKFVTSQDMITARNLYGHFFDFFPTHKTFVTTNHKPIVRGTDEGIWRRLHLIPFTTSIAESAVEQHFRERRLVPELSGILNWALAGVAFYLQIGLQPPATVMASTKDYRGDMDVIGQWIEERCEVNPQASIPSGEAYEDYSKWATEQVGWALKKLTFRRNLTDRGYAAAKGAQGLRMIAGLRLKSSSPRAASSAALLAVLDHGRTVFDDHIRDPNDGNVAEPAESSVDAASGLEARAAGGGSSGG